MILEIITIVFGIILIVQLYVIYNLYQKTDSLEQWVDSTYINIQETLAEFRKIDSTGHFEADDEIGVIFTQLKETLENLEKITEE
jgi:predicted Holliday junction resolvase-like endonuclease